MDAIMIHQLVKQFQPWVGSSLQSIYQYSEHALVLALRKGDQRPLLLIDTTPVKAHVAIISSRPDTTLDTPYYLQLFRHHLINGTLIAIEQQRDDRIIQLSFNVIDEIGQASDFQLIIELMGRATNIILCKADYQIIDALHRVPPSEVTKRTIHPGAFYRFPPSYQLPSLWNLRYVPGIPLANQVSGINELLVTELESRMLAGYTLEQLKQSINEQSFFYLAKSGSKLILDVIPLTHLGISFEQLEPSTAIERYYAQFAVEDERTRFYQQVSAHLKKLIKKLHQKKTNLEGDQSLAGDRDHYREWGQLLLTYIDDIPEHSKQFITPEGLVIPLKSEWSTSQNADYYFKRYKKLAKSLSILATQVALVDEQLAEYDYVLSVLDSADAQTLKQWRQELGLIPMPVIKTKQPTKYAPLVYRTSSGTRIMVGRNNLQNDYLSFQLAKPTDTFVHTLGVPGSHVCIASDHPTKEELTIAGELAAYFSAARQSPKVEVQWCLYKHVKKVPGGSLGKVRLGHFQSALFTPNENLNLKEIKS